VCESGVFMYSSLHKCLYNMVLLTANNIYIQGIIYMHQSTAYYREPLQKVCVFVSLNLYLSISLSILKYTLTDKYIFTVYMCVCMYACV